jgi:nucleoside-diphosphate-sugar epimerase
MSKPRVVVTGSCGLIGSEVCLHFAHEGYSVTGVDNNQRAVFFGPEVDYPKASPDMIITRSTSAIASEFWI